MSLKLIRIGNRYHKFSIGENKVEHRMGCMMVVQHPKNATKIALSHLDFHMDAMNGVKLVHTC